MCLYRCRFTAFCLSIIMIFVQGCVTFHSIQTDQAFRFQKKDILFLHQGDKTWVSKSARIIDQAQISGAFEPLSSVKPNWDNERELHFYLPDEENVFAGSSSGHVSIAKEHIQKAKIWSIDELGI